MRNLMRLAAATMIVAAACGDGGGGGGQGEGVELRLVTHDSFNVSDDVLAAFRKDTGIRVKVVPSGDAGAALNQAILTKDNPLGDVFFGVDNTFLTRALDEKIFIPYESPDLDEVDDRYKLDDDNNVTPIDHGEVCVNYDKEFFASSAPPETFDDLADPSLKASLVVQNPATSSPGLAFLLGTIAHFGEDGWQDYWRRLHDNDTQVTSGWEEAYNQSFSGGAGTGDRPLVVSYASSPPAEVVFAEEPLDEAPTGVMTATCFAQIEFAGIMRGTEHEAESKQLIDFMLSRQFQEDMPLQMFVFPVRDDAELPDEFVKHAAVVREPLTMDVDEIGRNRERWIDEWTSIMLR